MEGKFKRIIALILIVLLTNFIGGCWNRIEPENYAWLTWMGLDKVAGGKIKVTVVVTPPLSPVPTGVSPPENLMLASSATGDTVFDAVRNINDHLPKRLFWPYLQAVIVSSNLARSGLENYLDMLFRNVRLNKNAWVFITKGPTEPIFKINPQIEKSPAKLIDSLVETERHFLGKSRVIKLKDFQRELSGPGCDPVVSVLGVWDTTEGKVLPAGEKVPAKSGLALDGSAVFRGDKLVDWLSPEESQTYLLAKGEMKTGLIVVPHPDNQSNLAGIEVIDNSASLKAEMVDGQAIANISVKINGNLGDQRFNVPGQKQEDPSEDPEFYLKLDQQLAAKVKSDVEKLVAKSQTEFDSDIFGVGNHIMNLYPNDWDHVKANWLDYYKRAAIQVDVKVNINSANVMRSHLPAQEEGIN